MRYALMFILSLVAACAMVATVWFNLRHLRRIEEQLWGKKKKK